MKITAKQANVLRNLHRVTIRRVGSRREAFLDGDSCKLQLNSLGAKGLIVFDAFGRPVKVDKRVELFIVQYKRDTLGQAPAGPQAFAAVDTAKGGLPKS